MDWKAYGAKSVNLGLSGTKVPAVALENLKEELAFPFNENSEITNKNIQDWVNKYLDGQLEPYLKSQPRPQTNDGAVVTVVTDSFKEIVLDTSKDVFLEIYAPCKNFSLITSQNNKNKKESDQWFFFFLKGVDTAKNSHQLGTNLGNS